MVLNSAIERLYDLHVGIIGTGADRHERPHKALLLLAVFDLLDEGLASPDLIPWCRELRDRFSARFQVVRRLDDKNTPENPFFYLRQEGFWKPFLRTKEREQPLDQTPLVNDMGKVFARFTDGMDSLVAISANRQLMRKAIMSRYFPWAAGLLAGSQDSREGSPDPQLLVAEEVPEFGRSHAFRRKILAIYDHQCAACGLRIRLPSGCNVSFIDAAHLIPFSERPNDHPTNGLALCKNHHWAMDRQLIAPCPDFRWRVSSILERRRSNGESDLAELSGKRLLLPKEEAFYPDKEGLKWRCERLVA